MIGNLPLSTLLLAQAQFEHMGRRFKQGNDAVDLTTFATLVGLLITILVVALVASRIYAARHAPGYNDPQGLFRELCRLHGLDWASRRLLKRLAAQQALTAPAELFLDPRRLEPDMLGDALRPYQSRFARIAQVIFAGNSPEAPAEKT